MFFGILIKSPRSGGPAANAKTYEDSDAACQIGYRSCPSDAEGLFDRIFSEFRIFRTLVRCPDHSLLGLNTLNLKNRQGFYSYSLNFACILSAFLC